MTVDISFLFTAILFCLTVAGFIIARGQDVKKNARDEDIRLDALKESLLKCNMKLDQICATTNETRSDIKAMDKKITDMDKRVTVVERDLKACWEVIDDLRKGGS